MFAPELAYKQWHQNVYDNKVRHDTCHWQQTGAGVLLSEVFIWEFIAVYRERACTVALDKVTTWKSRFSMRYWHTGQPYLDTWNWERCGALQWFGATEHGLSDLHSREHHWSEALVLCIVRSLLMLLPVEYRALVSLWSRVHTISSVHKEVYVW